MARVCREPGPLGPVRRAQRVGARGDRSLHCCQVQLLTSRGRQEAAAPPQCQDRPQSPDEARRSPAGRASREDEAGTRPRVPPQGQSRAASTQQPGRGAGADAAGQSCGQQTITLPVPYVASPFSPSVTFLGIYPKAKTTSVHERPVHRGSQQLTRNRPTQEPARRPSFSEGYAPRPRGDSPEWAGREP